MVPPSAYLVHTSSQNGKAERIIRTLNDCVRSLLIHAGLPDAYWVEALSTATHLLNRRPCRASGQTTPFQLLLGAPPSYNHLRVFGCLCYPNQASTAPHTLDPRRVFFSATRLITVDVGVLTCKHVTSSHLAMLFLMKPSSLFVLKLSFVSRQ